MSADEHDLPADEHDLLMEISAAASAADMGPGTLRAYDREGLLKPIRTPSGTRLYTPEMVARARQIKAMRLRRFGAGRRRA